jgi:type IV secretory pathway VirB10-like protein
MTLPNGVSLNLQGMQGLDLRGMAGLADAVDHHIAELMAALTISTVFDLGKAAVATVLSTVDVLKDIGAILSAENSVTNSTNNAIQQVVVAYANKLLNQQPTITIREGNRGNIFVSKDIILPVYGIW